MVPVCKGGRIALDWLGEPSAGVLDGTQPVLIILHGLTGGSHERYVQWLAATAVRERGMVAVVMNARGCAGTELESAQGFCGAWTEDIRDTARLVRERLGPDAPIFAAGFSLGAGILTKYLVEEGSATPVDGAVSLCASYDFVKSIAGLERSWTGVIYRTVLTRSLLRYWSGHAGSIERFGNPAGIDADRVRASKIPRDFDQAVVAPMFDYRSAWDYYHDASTARFLADRIAIPYLGISADDDPICDVRGVPTWASQRNSRVFFALTQEGGHVAWATGMLASGKYWYEDMCMEFYSAVSDGTAPSKRNDIAPLVGRAAVATGVRRGPATIGATGFAIPCEGHFGEGSGKLEKAAVA
jgi:predicted alpha/beta-fold hydrolase